MKRVLGIIAAIALLLPGMTTGIMVKAEPIPKPADYNRELVHEKFDELTALPTPVNTSAWDRKAVDGLTYNVKSAAELKLPDAENHGKVLELAKDTTNVDSYLRINYQNNRVVLSQCDVSELKRVQASFDLYFTEKRPLNIRFYDNSSGSTKGDNLLVFSSNGTIRFLNGDTMPYETEKWYSFDVYLDFTNGGSYSVYCNGVLAAENLSTTNLDTCIVSFGLQMGAMTSAYTYYLDNMRFAIPDTFRLVESTPADGTENVNVMTNAATLTFSNPIADFDASKVTVTASGETVQNVTATENNSVITVTFPQELAYSTTYAIIVDAGLTDIYGQSLKEVKTITFTTITAPTYTVTASAGTGGSAAVTTEGTAFEEGTSVTAEATPEDGYKFAGWTATGVELTDTMANPLAIMVGKENVTLTANFAAMTDAAVAPTNAAFDQYTESADHKDIVVTLDTGDYTLIAVKNGETALMENTDYTVSSNTYTILTSYLETLTTDATLTFDMSGGTNPTLTITVMDTTPVSMDDVVKKVVLEQVMDGETATNQVYVYLEGYASGGSPTEIKNLVAVDLDFAITDGFAITTFAPANAEWTYEITEEGRYLIYEKGKPDGASDLDGQKILLGTLTLGGYGDGTITAATVNDAVQQRSDDGRNIVISSAAEQGRLNFIIAVPTKRLTVNVNFPNNIVDNAAAYQDMKAVISGGDLPEDIEVNFGSDGADGTVALASQTYTFTRELTEDTTYTVTITGAGYRTARYSVNMTDNKELTFWNNVKDVPLVVETGKDTSAVISNFLAGDIVGDNNINIYDLSAVVSYFGTVNDTTTISNYTKYDLNRDGVIDSKDVALVLVSWNN